MDAAGLMRGNYTCVACAALPPCCVCRGAPPARRQASLARMQQEYVDLLFCHRPDPDTPLEVT
jgi:hypothetical protein